MTMPPDESRQALQRAQDDAARKWLEAGAKGRPPWTPRERKTHPVLGVVLVVIVLVVVAAMVIAGFLAA
jgi:hypothetical protein